jgi:hypothetical protein
VAGAPRTTCVGPPVASDALNRIGPHLRQCVSGGVRSNCSAVTDGRAKRRPAERKVRSAARGRLGIESGPLRLLSGGPPASPVGRRCEGLWGPCE